MGASLRRFCVGIFIVVHAHSDGSSNDFSAPSGALDLKPLARQAVFAVTDGEVYAFDGLTGQLLFEDTITPLVRVQVASDPPVPLIIPSLSPNDGRLFVVTTPPPDSSDCCSKVPLGMREVTPSGNSSLPGLTDTRVSVLPGGTEMLLEQRETEWIGYSVNAALEIQKVGSLRTIGIPDAAALRRSLEMPDGGAMLLLGIDRHTAHAVVFDFQAQRWQPVWNVSKAFPALLRGEVPPASSKTREGPQLAVVATAEGRVSAFDPGERQFLGPPFLNAAARKWSVALPDRKPPLAVFGVIPLEHRVDTLLDFAEDLVVLCREAGAKSRSSSNAAQGAKAEADVDSATADGEEPQVKALDGQKCHGVAVQRRHRTGPEPTGRVERLTNDTTNVFVLQSHPGRLLAMVDPEIHQVQDPVAPTECSKPSPELDGGGTADSRGTEGSAETKDGAEETKDGAEATQQPVPAAVSYGSSHLWDPTYMPLALSPFSETLKALEIGHSGSSYHSSCLLGLHSVSKDKESILSPLLLPDPPAAELEDQKIDADSERTCYTSSALGGIGSAALVLSLVVSGWLGLGRCSGWAYVARSPVRTPCVVCHDRAAKYVITPCGHRCICGDCAMRIDNGGADPCRCPLCRCPVQDIVKIFE